MELDLVVISQLEAQAKADFLLTWGNTAQDYRSKYVLNDDCYYGYYRFGLLHEPVKIQH